MDKEEFTRLQRHVYNIAIPKIPINELEDFVSRTVGKIWSKRAQFQGKSSFSTWAGSIVRNEIASFYREKSLNTVPLSCAYSVADPKQLYPIEEVEIDIFLSQVLPMQEYQVFRLCWNGQMTQGDIARHLDIPLGTVKTRVGSSRVRLRRIYKLIDIGPRCSN